MCLSVAHVFQPTDVQCDRYSRSIGEKRPSRAVTLTLYSTHVLTTITQAAKLFVFIDDF